MNKKYFTKYTFASLLVLPLILLLSSSPLAAQSSFLQNQETKRITDLQETESATDSFLYPYDYSKQAFDWGGWLNYSFFDFQDEDNNSSTTDILSSLHYMDLRLWFKGTTSGGNSYYIRTKSNYSSYDWDPALNYDETDETELKLDMAYFDLSSYKKYLFRFGRQYFHIGRGLALSGIKDGLLLNGFYQNWNLKLFAAHSLPHENNIDTSVPGFDNKEKRFFYGVSGTWRSRRGNEIYLYYLGQNDNSDENPVDNTQDYRYDSQYLGLGTNGSFTRKSHYYAEIIHETGSSYAHGQVDSNTEDIDAWAGIAGTKYYFDCAASPVFTLEWAFGSGDGDRQSVTNTINGNLAGTKDHNFMYFGTYNGGDALSPRLSNMSVLRTGLTFKPFQSQYSLKDLSIGAYYSNYKKMKNSGAISDPEAVSGLSDDIGDGLDILLKWKVFSDLSIDLTWSRFNPGDCYITPNNATETLFYSTLIYSF
jgi:hypothetical protein